MKTAILTVLLLSTSIIFAQEATPNPESPPKTEKDTIKEIKVH